MGSAAPADTVAGIRISNPQRVIDATTGLTKLDLVRYYERFAEAMLPHLRRRPVALLRAPDGLGGELFFQKHVASSRLPGMKQLDPSLDPGHPPLMEIDTVEALIGAVQMNTVEFHTWNGTLDAKGSIDRPDRMTFDLDPGEGIAWKQMAEATRLTRALLDELRLRSFLKTSGGKGLHVVVPLERHDDWDTVRAFSKAVVEHLARTFPDRFVAKSGPSNRVGRIFVDYLRNGRGATTVAAFSARARNGLGVSVPLRWEQLERLQRSDQWNIRTLPPAPADRDAPWADYARTRQTLRHAMHTLAATA